MEVLNRTPGPPATTPLRSSAVYLSGEELECAHYVSTKKQRAEAVAYLESCGVDANTVAVTGWSPAGFWRFRVGVDGNRSFTAEGPLKDWRNWPIGFRWGTLCDLLAS